MATAKLEKLSEDFLHCSLCLESFRDPRSLGCLHTFCCPCLVSYSQSQIAGPGARLPCPMCREETTLPTEGVTGLKSNYFVKNLQELVGRVADAESCGLCDSGDVAVSCCVDCETVLCQHCTHIHSIIRTFKKHTVSPIKDPKESPTQDESNKCETHGEPFQFYCTESKCDQPLCYSCCKEHESHKVVDLKGRNEACRLNLSQALIQINALETMLHITQNFITEKQHSLSTNRDEVISSIDLHIEKTIESVRNTGEAFKQEVLNTFEEETAEVNKQLEEVSGLCTSASYTKHFIQQLLEKGSPADIMSIAQVVLRRVEDVLEKGNKERFIKDRLQTPISYTPGKLDDSFLQTWIGNLNKSEDVKDIKNKFEVKNKPEKILTFSHGLHDESCRSQISLACEGTEQDIALFDNGNKRLKVFTREGNLKWCTISAVLPSDPVLLEWREDIEAYLIEFQNKEFKTVKTWGIIDSIPYKKIQDETKFGRLRTSVNRIDEDTKEVTVYMFGVLQGTVAEGLVSQFRVNHTSDVSFLDPNEKEVIVCGYKDANIWRFDVKGKLLSSQQYRDISPLHSIYMDRYGHLFGVYFPGVLSFESRYEIYCLTETRAFSMLCYPLNKNIRPIIAFTSEYNNIVVVIKNCNKYKYLEE